MLILPYYITILCKSQNKLLLLQITHRIHLHSVDKDLKVKMRSRTSSRIAAGSNDLSLINVLSHGNIDLAQMTISGLCTIGEPLYEGTR